MNPFNPARAERTSYPGSPQGVLSGAVAEKRRKVSFSLGFTPPCKLKWLACSTLLPMITINITIYHAVKPEIEVRAWNKQPVTPAERIIMNKLRDVIMTVLHEVRHHTPDSVLQSIDYDQR